MNQKVDQLEKEKMSLNEKLQENQTSCFQLEEVLTCLIHKKSGELFSIYCIMHNSNSSLDIGSLNVTKVGSLLSNFALENDDINEKVDK